MYVKCKCMECCCCRCSSTAQIDCWFETKARELERQRIAHLSRCIQIHAYLWVAILLLTYLQYLEHLLKSFAGAGSATIASQRNAARLEFTYYSVKTWGRTDCHKMNIMQIKWIWVSIKPKLNWHAVSL